MTEKVIDGYRYIGYLSLPRIGRDLPILAELLARELRDMAAAMLGREPDPNCRILVAGLGNPAMTPDAVGPGTVSRLTVTRHLRGYDESLYAALGCCELSAVSPGVLGQTGMESAELVKCAAELVHPHLIVAVDALAAASCERLSSTVQLTDRGISPGAGIGNRRPGLNAETMGCPVMGVGIPTVVDALLDEDTPTMVTPREIDVMISRGARLLAWSIHAALQPTYSPMELSAIASGM